MGGLAVAAAANTISNNSSFIRLFIPSYAPARRIRTRNLSLPRKRCKFLVFVAKEDPILDRWYQMDLKFGKLLGEDPKLTLAKALEQNNVGSVEKRSAANAPSETKLVDSSNNLSMEAALQGKPIRLDQSVKGMSNFSREEIAFVNPQSCSDVVELENFIATSLVKEHEDNDWRRVEDLVRTGGREEVELISSSTRGFVVSFGSLIGFLPYRNLAARWKFLAFESG